MSLVNRQSNTMQARCRKCDHDLGTRTGAVIGAIYCSNDRCVYYRKPHPTGSGLNMGKAAA